MSNDNSTESNPRDEIIQTYLSTIEASFQQKKPQIKLINYGTGSGKTHQLFQAICQTIQSHTNTDTQVIGVYVAPLREHLKSDVEAEYPNIPFYVLYSQQQKVLAEFLQNYKKWIPAIRADKTLWNRLIKATSKEAGDKAHNNLGRVREVIKDFETLSRTSFTGKEELVKKQLESFQYEITNKLEEFLDFLIKTIPDERAWSPECFQLVRVFYPLHLLREKSGILMLTYDKFETQIPYFNFNGAIWVKRRSLLDAYVSAHSDDNHKFIFAFDEQEDGYQIMLETQIDVISPQDLAINNALSSITREFAVLFSSNYRENRDLLLYLLHNPGAVREFEEHFEKGKILEGKLATLAPAFERLVYEEGNSPEFLRQVARINEAIEGSMQNITNLLGSFNDGKPPTLDFEMLSRVFSKFENNRSLLIPRKVYAKFSEDLLNIFSYNNLFIYNLEPLKKLYLSHKTEGHVHITEEKTPNTASVAELIYAIFAVRVQIEIIKDFLENVLDAEDSQSRSLDIWSKQIGKMAKAGDTVLPTRFLNYMNRAYVYQSLKTIINIMEISRYQHPKNNLIHPSMREVSIGSTAIMTSPEHRIITALKNNSNVIFLISATGGVAGDLVTSFDLRYLEDMLRDESGRSSFSPMNDKELALSEQIRQYRLGYRKISVGFFQDDLMSFPNRMSLEAVKRFEEIVLLKFIKAHENEGPGFGIHKIHELYNFARFLFYLLEDDEIQEMIAFTQNLHWIKDLAHYAEMTRFDPFVFKRSEDNPGIFYIEVKYKEFQPKTKIKLIFYESRFNQAYMPKSLKKDYREELVEEDGQKILFISAYQSAGKGLNPTIKPKGGGEEDKDFDSIVLLMDRYFSIVGPTIKKSNGKDSDKNEAAKRETQFHFALMKSVVRLGDTFIEIKDFNKYLNSQDAADFQQLQHQILLGKGILQALGRTERRYYPGQVIKIFLNDESRKNLINFYRYLLRVEPNEIRKLSVNNFAVYEKVQEEEKRHSIQDYESHVFCELDATEEIQRFRENMLHEIDLLHAGNNTMDIVRAWELMRDPVVFQNPAKYLDGLRQSGLFPAMFVDALFYQNSSLTSFVPYLAEEEVETGSKVKIISDSLHGDKVYPYRNLLYPDYLKMNAGGFDSEGEAIGFIHPTTAQIQSLFREMLPQPNIFNTFIPRPPFFYDVLYPSLTETFTERWIQQGIFHRKKWPTIKAEYNGFEPLNNFKTYRTLYELFDLFYRRNDTLYCIDVKAWSKTSGYRLSSTVLEKASAKLVRITENYPEFKRVKGLLLNLHAPQEKSQKISTDLFSGNLISFDSNHLPFETNVLHNFLFSKED